MVQLAPNWALPSCLMPEQMTSSFTIMIFHHIFISFFLHILSRILRTWKKFCDAQSQRKCCSVTAYPNFGVIYPQIEDSSVCFNSLASLSLICYYCEWILPNIPSFFFFLFFCGMQPLWQKQPCSIWLSHRDWTTLPDALCACSSSLTIFSRQIFNLHRDSEAVCKEFCSKKKRKQL